MGTINNAIHIKKMELKISVVNNARTINNSIFFLDLELDLNNKNKTSNLETCKIASGQN